MLKIWLAQVDGRAHCEGTNRWALLMPNKFGDPIKGLPRWRAAFKFATLMPTR